MSRIINSLHLKHNAYKQIYFSITKKEIHTKPMTFKNNQTRNEIGPFGWFLLVVPITTFGLGTWQVKRKKWKEDLISDLLMRSQTTPVDLPQDLSELNALEYYPVRVTGTFDHSKELYLGPRPLLVNGEATTKGGLITQSSTGSTGYNIVTPFKLADRDLTILINRGWIPSKKKNPQTRSEGQIDGEITMVGVVRLNENRPTFSPKNIPEANSWLYRDLENMSKMSNAAPVFLDAVSQYSVDGGPIGGQTRISLRNEHLSYIFTWYSLCGFTSLMWYRRFIKRMPAI